MIRYRWPYHVYDLHLHVGADSEETEKQADEDLKPNTLAVDLLKEDFFNGHTDELKDLDEEG